jgi:hypothetical protein
MLTALLFTVFYGAVWGFLWGGLDAIFILKGFLATNEPIPSIIRSILAMFITSFITGLLLGGMAPMVPFVNVVVAIIVALYARPWVMARWRW